MSTGRCLANPVQTAVSHRELLSECRNVNRAASHGHKEIAELLLEGNNNWAVVTQQEDGKTALHLACMHRHADIASTQVRNDSSIKFSPSRRLLFKWFELCGQVD